MIRESRNFWVISEYSVVYAQGYTCGPNNPNYWWFPSLGWSMSYGHSAFDTREEAITVLKERINKEQAKFQNKLSSLNSLESSK